MSILEKEVWVTVGNRMDKYYESLGYIIPKHINKQGQIRSNIGEKILVKIEDLTNGSKILVTKICDDCGKNIPNQIYNQVLKYRKEGNGKDACIDCSKSKVWLKRHSNMPYEKSLEYYAKSNNKEYLLNQYSNKNDKKPYEVSYASNIKYLWNCSTCKGEYSSDVANKTLGGNNCPYCTHQKVLIGFNDLWTTKFEIAKLLVSPENGYNLMAYSNKKEDFKCADCGNIMKNKLVSNIVIAGGIQSPTYGDGIHYPEKFMFSFLEQLGIEFETQKTFAWSDNKRYDFFIPKLNIIIETHGNQHYEATAISKKGIRTLEQEQENDRLKETMAKENKINKYIVIDARMSTVEWIRSTIIDSELSNLYNLKLVNWLICHEFGCSSLVKVVCDYWNSGIKNTQTISEIIKLSRNTTIKYLKQGAKLGWCNYDPRENLRNNGKLVAGINKRSIIQLTLNNEFIKEWNSIEDARNELIINNVSAACRGVRKKAGGFRWMYKSEYTQLMNSQEVVQ